MLLQSSDQAIQSFWVDGTSEDLCDNFLSKEGPTSKLNQFVSGHANFWKFPRREILQSFWASCPSLSEGTSPQTFNRSSFAIALCTSEKNVTPFSWQEIAGRSLHRLLFSRLGQTQVLQLLLSLMFPRPQLF